MSRRPGLKRRVTVALAVGDGDLAARLAAEIARQPDLALANGGGLADLVIATALELGKLSPMAPTIVLIGDGPAEGLGIALRGQLPADADPSLVVAAARLVARGMVVLPEATLDPGTQPRDGDDDEPPADERIQLTPREREVLELLAAGASNKIIARRLGVSVHTAKFHVASLFRKLGASGRLEAVGIGLRTGLLMV